MFDCTQLQVKRAMTAALTYCAMVAALCLPSLALATPPDVIHIVDTPIAANEEAIFVERRTADNLGSHYEMRVEKFLVSIAIDSGEETIWPIYGALRTYAFHEDPKQERYIVVPDPSERWHNPNIILAKAKAFPLQSFVPWKKFVPPEAKAGVGTQKDHISITYPDGPTFAFSHDAAIARFNRSVATLAKEVVDADRIVSLSTRSLFLDREAEPASCTFAAEGEPIRLNTNVVQMVRITCLQVGDMETTSFVFPVRSTGSDAPAS